VTTGRSRKEARSCLVGVTLSVARDSVDKVLAVTAYARRREEAALIQMRLIVIGSAHLRCWGVAEEATQSSSSSGSLTTAR
jgi:hypothetical protein